MKAFLVFLDESGLLMAPLVRRSWAPRGLTPLLYQRTRSHQKVSVIAALCLAPDHSRVHLYFRLHPGANIRTAQVLEFLRILRRHLGSPAMVIWDRLQAHRSKKVTSWLRSAATLEAVLLPPYAPELNPVEYVWAYLKRNPLANFAPAAVEELAGTARGSTRALQRDQTLLRSFLHQSPLFLDSV